MKKCQKCGCEFRYVEILKVTGSINDVEEIKCRNCGCINKLKIHKLLIAFFISAPILLLLLLQQMQVSTEKYLIFIAVYLVYCICLKLIEPFFIGIRENK